MALQFIDLPILTLDEIPETELKDSEISLETSEDLFEESMILTLSLEQEYLRWQTTYLLLKTIQKNFQNKKQHYEVKNIVERFLLSSANALSSLEDVPDKVYADWPKDHPLFQKMKGEFVEKRLFRGKRLDGIVNGIQSSIRTFLKSLSSLSPEDEVKSRGKGSIQYKNFKMSLPPERWALFQKQKISLRSIALMVMRYQSIICTSQQWNVPRDVFKNVLQSLDVSVEGFASPLNAQLPLVSPDSFSFGSLFPDTDAVFGSFGDLFSVDMAFLRGKTVFNNPPFIEPLLDRYASLQEKWLSSIPIRLIVFVPEWTDAAFYIRLDQSPYLVYKKLLRSKEYFYESTCSQGHVKPILARYPSRMFVFSSLVEASKPAAFYHKLLE
jgi:hypothetical protein